MSHITGGGLAANISRVLPEGLTAVVDRTQWEPAPIFRLIAERGGVARNEMETAFNMSIGMVVVADPAALSGIFEQSAAARVGAAVIGQVRETSPQDVADSPAKGGSGGLAMLVGDHPGD